MAPADGFHDSPTDDEDCAVAASPVGVAGAACAVYSIRAA